MRRHVQSLTLVSLWASQTGVSVMSSVDLVSLRGQPTASTPMEPWLISPCAAITQVSFLPFSRHPTACAHHVAVRRLLLSQIPFGMRLTIGCSQLSRCLQQRTRHFVVYSPSCPTSSSLQDSICLLLFHLSQKSSDGCPFLGPCSSALLSLLPLLLLLLLSSTPSTVTSSRRFCIPAVPKQSRARVNSDGCSVINVASAW